MAHGGVFSDGAGMCSRAHVRACRRSARILCRRTVVLYSLVLFYVSGWVYDAAALSLYLLSLLLLRARCSRCSTRELVPFGPLVAGSARDSPSLTARFVFCLLLLSLSVVRTRFALNDGSTMAL